MPFNIYPEQVTCQILPGFFLRENNFLYIYVKGFGNIRNLSYITIIIKNKLYGKNGNKK